jgi:hypothetical protein
VDQILRCDPGKTYFIAFRAKSEGNLAPVVRIADMNYRDIALIESPSGEGWREAMGTFVAPDGGTVRLQIFPGAVKTYRDIGEGKSIVDDVRVHPEK